MVVQLQILNKVLASRDKSLLNELNEDFFSRYKNEYNFIINHFKEYNQVPDQVTFINIFPDFDITEVNESNEYLLKELYKEKEQNDLIKILNKSRELILDKKVDKAKANLVNALSELNKSVRIEAIDILHDTSRYDEYVDKCSNKNKYYISTGFKELDAALGGFDTQNELAVIIARPGVGKSFCLMKCISASVQQGLRVGLYSGEMTVSKVAYRIDTIMSHISLTKLNRGNSNVAVDYKKYLDNMKQNSKGCLYVLTPDMIPDDPTVDSLEAFIEKYNLDVIYVDQQTLLADNLKAKTSFEKAANISKALKMLQVRKRIPVITVTQQNRASIEDGKFAGTENVSGSDRISQDSSLIISISKEDNIMTLYITKARDGGTGMSFNYLVDLDHGEWEYIPGENDSFVASIETDDMPTFSYNSDLGEDIF